MRTLYWHTERRAGRLREAVEYRTLAMSGAMRQAGGGEAVRLLHAALKFPAQREKALPFHSMHWADADAR